MSEINVFTEAEYEEFLRGEIGENALRVGYLYTLSIADGTADGFAAHEVFAMCYLQGYMDGENNTKFQQGTEGLEITESGESDR